MKQKNNQSFLEVRESLIYLPHGQRSCFCVSSESQFVSQLYIA